MAISRSQLVKKLEPGLNALFGMEGYTATTMSMQKFSDTENRQIVRSKKKVMLSRFGKCSYFLKRGLKDQEGIV